MLDVNLLRRDPETVAASLAHRNITGVDLDDLADLDQQRRRARSEAEALRSQQKEHGSLIARLEGKEKAEAIARGTELAADYKEKLAEADSLDAEFEQAWVPLPNLVHESVPKGADEEDNEEIKQWGEIPAFDFEP